MQGFGRRWAQTVKERFLHKSQTALKTIEIGGLLLCLYSTKWTLQLDYARSGSWDVAGRVFYMSCRNFFIQEFTFGNIISSTTLSFAAPHIYRRATHAKNSPRFCPVSVWPWPRFRTESPRRWKRLQHPESRSILWSLSSSVEFLEWWGKGHPTQQRSRGKQVRKKTLAVFAQLKRSAQIAAGRD